jgi:hypothetical protein
MLDDDEGPKDFEIKDEEPPEWLRKRWEKEEVSSPQGVVCPSCKKETPSGNLTCIFCETVLPQGSCPFRFFFAWVKRLFKKGDRKEP